MSFIFSLFKIQGSDQRLASGVRWAALTALAIGSSLCANGSGRNIYLDLGAFCGDTLTMHNLNGVPSRCLPEVPWEVFAFEPCPMLAHAAQLRADRLNCEENDPPLEYRDIPGMLAAVSEAYEKKLPFDKKLACFFEKYQQELIKKVGSKGPYRNFWEISDATSLSSRPAGLNSNRYHVVPAGVGVENGCVWMDWSPSNYMNGGGNFVGIQYQETRRFLAPVIRLSEWIQKNFSKNDFIYVKMDIEGMEYSVIEDLISSGCLDFIDEMDVEWHGRFLIPGFEREDQLKKRIIEKNILLREHY